MSEKMLKEWIAPCGMNCRLCIAYIREKNRCPGCNSEPGTKMASCEQCSIKNCPTIRDNDSGFCYECETFPCRRMKQLDKRYRTKYRMSMIENLKWIEEHGLEDFLKREGVRWECGTCGEIVSAHRTECPNCGVTCEEKLLSESK